MIGYTCTCSFRNIDFYSNVLMLMLVNQCTVHVILMTSVHIHVHVFLAPLGFKMSVLPLDVSVSRSLSIFWFIILT